MDKKSDTRLGEAWRTLRSIIHRTVSLQPALDYFELLHAYVDGGMLEVMTATSEGYITQPALHALSCTDEMLEVMRERTPMGSNNDYLTMSAALGIRRAVRQTAHFIRLYTQFLDRWYEEWMRYQIAADKHMDDPATQQTVNHAAENLRRMKKPVDWNSKPKGFFALHVVGDQYPHELLYTIILKDRRRWWWPFWRKESMDIITYRS